MRFRGTAVVTMSSFAVSYYQYQLTIHILVLRLSIYLFIWLKKDLFSFPVLNLPTARKAEKHQMRSKKPHLDFLLNRIFIGIYSLGV